MQKSEAHQGVEKTFYLNASLCDLSFAGKTKGLSKDIGFFIINGTCGGNIPMLKLWT